MTFGERLTQLRKENGYATRSEFANKLGIPCTTLRNYETNAREPGCAFLRQISILFNISVDYLLCLTDDKEVLNSFRIQKGEKDLVENYRKLDSQGKEVVDYILIPEIDSARYRESAQRRLQTYSARLSTHLIAAEQSAEYSAQNDTFVSSKLE